MPIKTLKNPPQNLQIIHNYLILPWAAHMAQIWKFMTKIRLRHPLLHQFCTCDSSSHESFFTLREIEFLGHCNRDKSVPVPPENQKKHVPYVRHYKPRLVYFLTTFPKSIYVLWPLALCMACIQERLLIKSGLWWRAYGK